MNNISFHDTHVYPGCLATVAEKIVSPGTTVPAIAEFSDGSMATAVVEPLTTDEMILHIDAYSTARHTRIPAKAWRARYDDDEDIWKVVARV